MSGKRRTIINAALGLGAALGLTACGGSSGPVAGTPTSNGAGKSTSGGTTSAAGGALTVAWPSVPDTLNPAVTEPRGVEPLDAAIFATLTYDATSGQVTPYLATSWTTSANGKTYAFTLRKGITFSDGTAVDAQAIAFNINYVAAKSTLSVVAVGLLGPCTHANAVSTYVVQISCTQPFAPLLANLGEPYLGIQSPASIKKFGTGVGNHPTGSGPFELVSYTPNQSLALKRNPAYTWAPPSLHETGPAKLSSLTFDFVTSPGARASELESGQAQLAVDVPGFLYTRLAASYTNAEVPVSGLGNFAFIDTAKFPTSELAVRQAILYSLNKPGLLKTTGNVYPVQNTPLQSGVGYDPALNAAYPYDPAKAAALLTAAGWKKVNGTWTQNGKPLSLVFTVLAGNLWVQISEAMQGALQSAGFQVKLLQLPQATSNQYNTQAKTNLEMLEYVAVDPDALRIWFAPGQFLNWSHYNNPALAKLLTDGEQTSGAARAAIYEKAQQIIMANAIEIPMYKNVDLLTAAKQLSGVTYDGGGNEMFSDASLG